MRSLPVRPVSASDSDRVRKVQEERYSFPFFSLDREERETRSRLTAPTALSWRYL